jgi:hypothetical protein
MAVIALRAPCRSGKDGFRQIARRYRRARIGSAHRLGKAASDLGLEELEAIGLDDADAMLGSCNRIEDRRASHLGDAVDFGAGRAGANVHLEGEVGDDRLVERVAGRDENMEHGGAGFGVLTSQDAEKGSPLLGRCATVEHVHDFAFPFVNGAGPAKNCRSLQPVEPRRPMEATLDIVHRQGVAVSVGR